MTPRPPAGVLAALLFAAAPLPAPAQLAPATLNPASRASPSGEYVLHVDPTDPRGAGPGRHRLDRLEGDGKRALWERTLPFTLWEAAVTDDGVSVGYGYTGGRHGTGIPLPTNDPNAGGAGRDRVRGRRPRPRRPAAGRTGGRIVRFLAGRPGGKTNEPWRPTSLTWAGGDVWLAVGNPYADAAVWRIDAAAGTALRVPGFDPRGFDAVAGLPDGGLAALFKQFDSERKPDWSVARFHADGRERWRVDLTPDAPLGFTSGPPAPEDVAAGANGEVALLEEGSGSGRVRVFDADGRVVRTVSEIAAGSPQRLLAAEDGWIVGSSRQLVRIDKESVQREELALCDPHGRPAVNTISRNDWRRR